MRLPQVSLLPGLSHAALAGCEFSAQECLLCMCFALDSSEQVKFFVDFSTICSLHASDPDLHPPAHLCASQASLTSVIAPSSLWLRPGQTSRSHPTGPDPPASGSSHVGVLHSTLLLSLNFPALGLKSRIGRNDLFNVLLHTWFRVGLLPGQLVRCCFLEARISVNHIAEHLLYLRPVILGLFLILAFGPCMQSETALCLDLTKPSSAVVSS